MVIAQCGKRVIDAGAVGVDLHPGFGARPHDGRGDALGDLMDGQGDGLAAGAVHDPERRDLRSGVLLSA